MTLDFSTSLTIGFVVDAVVLDVAATGVVVAVVLDVAATGGVDVVVLDVAATGGVAAVVFDAATGGVVAVVFDAIAAAGVVAFVFNATGAAGVVVGVVLDVTGATAVFNVVVFIVVGDVLDDVAAAAVVVVFVEEEGVVDVTSSFKFSIDWNLLIFCFNPTFGIGFGPPLFKPTLATFIVVVSEEFKELFLQKAFERGEIIEKPHYFYNLIYDFEFSVSSRDRKVKFDITRDKKMQPLNKNNMEKNYNGNDLWEFRVSEQS